MDKFELLKRNINEDLIELRKMAKEQDEVEVYQFFHGNNLIMVGTLQEISRYTRHSVSTLKNYSYQNYLAKATAPTSPRVIPL